MQFDSVLGPEACQEDVYEGVQVDNLIKNVIDGFHSTIFCYGQTGSGKTYSMDGYQYRKTEKGIFLPNTDEMQAETEGLVQRSVRQLID